MEKLREDVESLETTEIIS